MVARRLYVPEAQPSRDPNGRALPAELADKLAQGPTKSYAGSKRQLNHWALHRD